VTAASYPKARLIPTIESIKGRAVYSVDRTFRPVLQDPEGSTIEDMYGVEVEYNSGEVKTWTFDDLEWWAKDKGFKQLYCKVLNSAIALDRQVGDRPEVQL